MSTFHGLEMAKRALSTQQAALYTTGHNISNANTDGYSRQRVNFNSSIPYPAVGKNRPQIPGQMGTGVEVGSVERIRNEFLDKQFRAENSRAGFWDTQSRALSRMEELLNEPSKTGLSHTINEFWEALEDLSVDPSSDGARSVVAHRGLAVAETFNHLSETLHSIQDDLYQEMDTTVDHVNSLLSQINDINNQLKQIEPHGYLANDLYDTRDVLIDELSEIMSIKVSYESVGGNAQDIAQGIVSIELADRKGASLGEPIQLIDGSVDYNDGYFNDFITLNPSSNTGAIEEIHFKDGEGSSLAADDFIEQSIGSLGGLIDSFGYNSTDDDGNDVVKGHYPEMIDNLNKMAQAMADEFNRVHRLGLEEGAEGSQNFFEIDEANAAGSITVLQEILDNPELINANSGEGQDGENALELANVFSEIIVDGDLDGYSINSYFEHIIGVIGVDAREANRMSDNTGVLRSQVDEQRMSVSAVSLDEEMTNMLKFQHAYNAAARSMTAIDELLDRIINGMGLVGR